MVYKAFGLHKPPFPSRLREALRTFPWGNEVPIYPFPPGGNKKGGKLH